MAALSGHGSALAFGTTTAWTPLYTTIGTFGYSGREKLDISTLATVGSRDYVAGDLYDVDGGTSTYLVDPAEWATDEDNEIDQILFTDITGTALAAETLTITLPDSGAATISGTGYVTALEFGELATNTILTATLTHDWLGAVTLAE